jgi:hypothetical protein
MVEAFEAFENWIKNENCVVEGSPVWSVRGEATLRKLAYSQSILSVPAWNSPYLKEWL